MADVTNKTLSTGSVTNKALGPSSITWDQATFTWNEATGTWDNPYALTNRSLNTATVTNNDGAS